MQKSEYEINIRKVVEHNDLITSVAKMDKVPLKIFELAVSCIDISNPPKDNIVYLSKKTLFTFFDVKDSNKNSRFKEAVEKMQKQAHFVIKESSKKGNNGYKYESIVPIPYFSWNDYSDEVTIEFNHRIMPYLVDIKSNFTKYLIRDIMELNSKYSIILYKWLSMNYNQYEHYRHTLKRNKIQLESYKNPTISMDELRRITDTTEDYKEFSDFEKRILKTAKKEISQYTHFNLDYIKVKKGRSITEIQFFINKKPVAPNSFYKEEQQDPLYLENKAVNESERKDLYLAAQQSPYTKMLLLNNLLDFSDVLDMDIMIELSKFVYPLYNELSNLRRTPEVERHLNYVKNHQESYSKQNKSKYLRISIEDYLATIKFQDSLKK